MPCRESLGVRRASIACQQGFHRIDLKHEILQERNMLVFFDFEVRCRHQPGAAGSGFRRCEAVEGPDEWAY